MTTTVHQSDPLPQPAAFAVTVEEARGHVSVRIVGELDAWTAPALVEALRGLESRAGIPAQRRGEVELDLSRLTFLDTAGLSALSDTRLALRTSGWRVRLIRPQPNVGRLLAYAVESGWLPDDLMDQAPASA